MPNRTVASVVLAVAALSATSAPASAQVFGTFPWQMQPYCNRVTLTLSSSPAGFVLEGVDDQCGATHQASAVGMASFSASGNVTMNFSIVTAPAGRPVHVSAVVSPGNGSGTWTDSAGNTGTFAFFGSTPGLPPRPLPGSGLPAAIITTTELADNAVTGAKVANGSLTSADIVDVPRAAFAGGGQQIALSAADSIVRSLSLTVPAPGRVIVNASAFGHADSATTVDRAGCSITTGSTRDSGTAIFFGEQVASVPTKLSFPLALTQGFSVNAGPFNVNLICQASSGSVLILNSSMTAMYFPG